MCLTVSGEEEGRCGVDVVQGGIPHDGACPQGGGSHNDGQYPWPEGGQGGGERAGTLDWMPDWR
jgi:hypothetical protein